MYNECLSCPKLGVSCDGPNFVAMTASELLEWCKARKQILKLSNAKLGELSNTPKGTIDRLFAGEHGDFKYETVRPLLHALVGGVLGGNPCPIPETGLEEKLAQAVEENKKLAEYIKQIEKDHDEEIDELKDEHREDTRFLRGQVKSKNTAIIILGILLFITLSIIFAALVIDYMNNHIGFFWLE